MTSAVAMLISRPTLPPSIRGIIFDIDGVLFVSGQPIPGAVEAVNHLRELDIPHVFLTNMTRPRSAVLARLGSGGIETDPSLVLTAPTATVAYLQRRHPGARCLLLASDALREDFDAINLTDDPKRADVVVVGGPHEDSSNEWFSYARLNDAFRALQGGAALVAMQRGRSWKTSGGMLLDAGAFVVGLEQAAGVRATICGKPSRVFFDSALDRLGMPASAIAMVGDDVDNDIRGAEQAGVTAVLVRTGKFSAADAERVRGIPFYLVDSVADLPAMLSVR